MPTAVVEVELKHRAAAIEIRGAYDRALVLLRWAGRPVGQLTLPVVGTRVDEAVFEEALARWAGWDFWLAWLYDCTGL